MAERGYAMSPRHEFKDAFARMLTYSSVVPGIGMSAARQFAWPGQLLTSPHRDRSSPKFVNVDALDLTCRGMSMHALASAADAHRLDTGFRCWPPCIGSTGLPA